MPSSASPGFDQLSLPPATLENLRRLGYLEMTAIQAAALPPALQGKDELGGLTRAFAQMTQQLADARSAVEKSMDQVSAARANLQTILDNLTAGVMVLDAQGRIQTANPGGARILRLPLEEWQGQPLAAVPGLEAFGATVQQRFDDLLNERAPQGADHWQQSFELNTAHAGEPAANMVTLVTRGAPPVTAPATAPRDGASVHGNGNGIRARSRFSPLARSTSMRCPCLIPALTLLLGITVSAAAARAASLPVAGPWTEARDASPAFTPDGATVLFTRGSGTARRLYVAHRHGDGWSTPVPAPFSKRWMDFEPTMAPDGRYLVFVSNRPARGEGKPLDGRWGGHDYPGRGGNLWRVDRRDGGWGTPRHLPDAVNAGSSTFSPGRCVSAAKMSSASAGLAR